MDLRGGRSEDGENGPIIARPSSFSVHGLLGYCLGHQYLYLSIHPSKCFFIYLSVSARVWLKDLKDKGRFPSFLFFLLFLFV